MLGRRLSQNFLFDPSILRRIVQAADLGPGDTVVEIGPGPGKLTMMLSETVARVIAVELDPRLHEKLKDHLSGRDNVELVRGDALKYPYGRIEEPFKVVANIPYHITTPIIFKLLEHRRRLVSMTLTVQKEVARRVAAAPGGKDYGVLSLTVQYYGRARVEFVIPRGAFRPVPKVDSACLRVEVLEKPSVDVSDEELFFRIIRTAFSQRRKTLHNSLKKLCPGINGHLEAVGIDPALRAERLGMEHFATLADELAGLEIR
jgi:16S rRNA (adenine1518-N6/adenine1519-N6)-dimethyltransferase